MISLIIKYVDDTNILVPEHSDISMQTEFANVQDWVRQNKMTVNLSKSKEIVFCRPQPSKLAVHYDFSIVEHITDVRLLHIILSENVSFENHLNSNHVQ